MTSMHSPMHPHASSHFTTLLHSMSRVSHGENGIQVPHMTSYSNPLLTQRLPFLEVHGLWAEMG